jgi:hypothetical protein
MDKPTKPEVFGEKSNENQIIVNSGRLLFNAKDDYILGFSDKGINFSTNGGFHINGGTGKNSLTHINTEKIYLGLDAEKKGEPLLMGNTTEEWLRNLIECLEQMIISWETQIAPTAWLPGGGGVPVAIGALSLTKTQLLELKQKVSEVGQHPLLSNLAFVRKNK